MSSTAKAGDLAPLVVDRVRSEVTLCLNVLFLSLSIRSFVDLSQLEVLSWFCECRIEVWLR